jgi:hypothetical protein
MRNLTLGIAALLTFCCSDSATKPEEPGSYSSAGRDLAIGALACTRAYCGEGSLFNAYVAALDSAVSFERSGTSLWIRHPRVTLRFTANP